MNSMKQLFSFGLLLAFGVSAWAQAPRTVLLEVTESTWDMNTAEVICAKEAIRDQYADEVVIISYHTDNVINGGDPLYNTTAENWSDALGINAFARGLIDRVSYNGTSLISVTSSDWADTIASRLNRTSIGLVTLPEVLYDPDTRGMYVRVQIDFKKDIIELNDYRFYFTVVRNGMLADQLVDTNTSLCGPLSNGNDTVFSFSHQDVAFSTPSGATGIDNVIPVEIDNGARFTRAFNYTVPASVDLNELHVVGFVANWGGQTNITQNNVINVAQAASFTTYDSSDESDPNHPNNPDNPNSIYNPGYWPTAVEELPVDEKVILYPNPMDELGILEFTVPAQQNVSVNLYSMEGKWLRSIYNQELAAGQQKAAISGNGLESGIYIVRIKGETFERYARLVRR
jgi:hypothetical protein